MVFFCFLFFLFFCVKGKQLQILRVGNLRSKLASSLLGPMFRP